MDPAVGPHKTISKKSFYAEGSSQGTSWFGEHDQITMGWQNALLMLISDVHHLGKKYTIFFFTKMSIYQKKKIFSRWAKGSFVKSCYAFKDRKNPYLNLSRMGCLQMSPVSELHINQMFFKI